MCLLRATNPNISREELYRKAWNPRNFSHADISPRIFQLGLDRFQVVVPSIFLSFAFLKEQGDSSNTFSLLFFDEISDKKKKKNIVDSKILYGNYLGSYTSYAGEL